jgi:hypothetical protein
MRHDQETGGALLSEAWERIREVRIGLEDAAAWLPEQCSPVLSEALVRLQPLPAALAEAGPHEREAARQTAVRLRGELLRVRTLLDSSAAFLAGWSRLRSGLTAGYTAQGRPADAPASHRVSLAG